MSDGHAEELVRPEMILPPSGGIGVATPIPTAIVKQPLAPTQVLDLPSLEIKQPRSLTALEDRVTAYLQPGSLLAPPTAGRSSYFPRKNP